MKKGAEATRSTGTASKKGSHIRMPEELKQRLQERAEQEGTSLNKAVVKRLADSLERDDQESLRVAIVRLTEAVEELTRKIEAK